MTSTDHDEDLEEALQGHYQGKYITLTKGKTILHGILHVIWKFHHNVHVVHSYLLKLWQALLVLVGVIM